MVHGPAAANWICHAANLPDWQSGARGSFEADWRLLFDLRMRDDDRPEDPICWNYVGAIEARCPLDHVGENPESCKWQQDIAKQETRASVGSGPRLFGGRFLRQVSAFPVPIVFCSPVERGARQADIAAGIFAFEPLVPKDFFGRRRRVSECFDQQLIYVFNRMCHILDSIHLQVPHCWFITSSLTLIPLTVSMPDAIFQRRRGYFG